MNTFAPELRERMALGMAARGLGRYAIAQALGVSVITVEGDISRARSRPRRTEPELCAVGMCPVRTTSRSGVCSWHREAL